MEEEGEIEEKDGRVLSKECSSFRVGKWVGFYEVIIEFYEASTYGGWTVAGENYTFS